MSFFPKRNKEAAPLPTPPNVPDTPLDRTNTNGRSFDINSSDYAHRCRRIMKIYQKLRALGVHVSYDLPRVVVIGDQSSGKSSLVEAVTGINVPRDSGTCTRCPMECTMSSDAESWSCTIEIRNEPDSPDSLPISRKFTDIETKSDMELAIRRAQAAVLSPHKESTEFLRMSADQIRDQSVTDGKCEKFSKNVVQINVNDPEATDLSFVDLPGLIHNAEPNVIETVRKLVEHYIEGKKNTVVVIAMPMTDDYEKMEAVRLAKDSCADPSGSRTIGVLTKPDLLISGLTNARTAWKAVLEGRSHQTRHGYFCVRLPDDEERKGGIKQVKLNRLADEFFNNASPWNEISDRSRFGIPNLVRYTSDLLIQLIHDYLPELEKQVDDELVRCRLELALLPHKSTESPKTIIMLSITAFCQDIFDMVFGNKEKNFVQSNRALYSRFKQEIIATTPDFRPCETLSGHSIANKLVAHSATEPRTLRDVRKVIKRCITWELPKHIPFEATKTLILQYTALWTSPALKCFNGVFQNLTSKLEYLLETHFGRYFKLKAYIMQLSFADRDRNFPDAKVVLRKILDFETDPIFTHNFDLFSEQERLWYSRYVSESPFHRRPVLSSLPEPSPDPVNFDGTRDEWGMASVQGKKGRKVKAPSHLIFSESPPVEFGGSEDEPVTPICQANRPVAQPKPAVLHSFPEPPPDPAIDGSEETWTIEDEIKIMANVQAYFQVAHKRFMDYVPLTIEHEMNQNFAKRIRNTLIDNIYRDEEGAVIDMHSLLDEDPVIAKQRACLEGKISGLEKIKLTLEEYRLMDDISFDTGDSV